MVLIKARHMNDLEDFGLIALLVMFFIMTVLLGYHTVILEWAAYFLAQIKFS